VILAGVHDVKTLKLKLRPDEEQKFNSPWNIASDFKVEMSLMPHEVVPMLEEYARDRGVVLDAPKMAELLYYYTSGYPFLVSKLCKMMDEDILPQKQEKTWTEEDIENAVNQLVKESNANFDSLTKNLENNPELYDLTYRIVVESERITFNRFVPVVSLGLMYGVFVEEKGFLKIHNRIYQEIIGDYMTFKTQQSSGIMREKSLGMYEHPSKGLDMEKLLLRFQSVMQEEYSKNDRDFLERNGRLVFLAFLKPILNGVGYAFKEPQISEERRLDVVITYMQKKYLVELKVWRGEKAHRAGIEQLADYLERQNLDVGYLLIFDNNATKEWKKQRIRKAGKRIFAVWV
jgi:hypothetical protein